MAHTFLLDSGMNNHFFNVINSSNFSPEYKNHLQKIMPICSNCDKFAAERYFPQCGHLYCNLCDTGKCPKCEHRETSVLISSNPVLVMVLSRIREQILEKVWPRVGLPNKIESIEDFIQRMINAVGRKSSYDYSKAVPSEESELTTNVSKSENKCNMDTDNEIKVSGEANTSQHSQLNIVDRSVLFDEEIEDLFVTDQTKEEIPAEKLNNDASETCSPIIINSTEEDSSKKGRTRKRASALKNDPVANVPKKIRRGKAPPENKSPARSPLSVKGNSLNEETPVRETRRKSLRSAEQTFETTKLLMPENNLKREQSSPIPEKNSPIVSPVKSAGARKYFSSSPTEYSLSLSGEIPKSEESNEGIIKKEKKLNTSIRRKKVKVQGSTPSPGRILRGDKSSTLKNIMPSPSVNRRNSRGETQLHEACKRKNFEAVASLINLGADVNVQDFARWTPLHDAVRYGELSVIELLLENNALVNAAGNANRTPLHVAIEEENIEVVKLLLKYGADPDVKNVYGETPRSSALQFKDNKELINTIRFWHKVPPKCEFINQMPAMVLILNNHLSSDRRSQDDQKGLLQYLTCEYNGIIKMATKSTATHVVFATNADCILRNWEILTIAMGNGAWVLSSEWLQQIKLQGKLVPEEEYALTLNWLPGLAQARFNRLKLQPGLFSGLHFYFGHLPNTITVWPGEKLLKYQLKDLIITMGGLERKREPDPEGISGEEEMVPYHDHDGPLSSCSDLIVIDQENYKGIRYNMTHIKTVPLTWLIECIEHFSLLPPP